jgi:hypothetical protein
VCFSGSMKGGKVSMIMVLISCTNTMYRRIYLEMFMAIYNKDL